eukprot:GFUD01041593.1.p1 GENE.GFUD01041593.1~~GFUD01041593.1.p1  ORF type:complete len:419 (+),score=138.92 GFUD01041593.1:400-1656(+)
MSSVGSFESSGEEFSEDFEVLNQDHFSNSSIELEDIQEAIQGVKRTILETEVSSQARKDLVHKLIRLRIKREDLENRKYFQVLPGELESLGHNFLPADSIKPTRVLFCDECGGTLWHLLQTVYGCKTCSHLVHGHCLNNLRRRCVGAFLNNFDDDEEYGYFDGSLLFRICPELSLAEQNFSCAECDCQFKQFGEARLCDYTGRSYCFNCHWAGLYPSPARIVHNWDFTPQTMSQAALQYINIVNKKPLVNLEQINPSLSAVIQEVGVVARQRKQLLSMKKYLMVCRIAQEERVLTQLQDRQHFVDSAHMYSLQDLLDINTGSLSEYLTAKLAAFQSHITSCVLCVAKSFVCEICIDRTTGRDTLFPFDEMVESCVDCEAVYHRDCFRSVSQCPRCSRKKEKKVEGENLACSVFTVGIN